MRSLSTRALLMILGVAVIALLAGLALVSAHDGAAVHPAFASPPSALATPPLGAVPGEPLVDAIAQAHQDGALLLLLALALLAAILAYTDRRELKRLRAPAMCLAGYVVSVPIAAVFLASEDLVTYGQVRFVSELLRQIALAGMAATFVLHVVFRIFRTPIPVILADIVLAGTYVAIALTLLSRAGVNVSGIIATSAVLTAVIGFSLQDSLGNIMSGVFLEMEDVINVGDWVKVGDVVGQVRERRWRQTTVETRDWGVAVIPNSVIMKNQVLIYGRRGGQGAPHRRWIWFNIDLSSSPTLVMSVVHRAMLDAPIDNVALEPRPSCVCMDFKDGIGAYALRYWLKDLATDDGTDSRVRERLYNALQRANLRIAPPVHGINLVEESEDRVAARTHRDIARRVSALRKVEIFRMLDDKELTELAEHLRYAPYASGERITAQGDTSDSLFLIVQGRTAVTVEKEGIERKVAELAAGDVFGEMGMLTGEARSASVHATGPVECWRVDREGFEGIIQRRPEIALELARILALRRSGLEEVRESLDRDVEAATRLKSAQDDIMKRISRFLRLGNNV